MEVGDDGMDCDELPERVDWEASDVWTTGGNSCGQCGVGHTDGRATYTRVKSRKRWTHVAIGDSHLALVAVDGSVHTCGLNDRGQCGSGDPQENRLAPGRVEALADAVCVSAACGFEHTAVVTSSGDLFCFGSNDSGQCGCDSDVSCVTLPRLVRLPRGGPPPRVAAVACGTSHTLAVTATGALFAWGANAAGQLGTGDTTPRRSPTPVQWLQGVVVTVCAAGDVHSCAVAASGDAYAWGRAASGVLGIAGEAAPTSQQPASQQARPAPAAVVAALCDMGIPRCDAERAASATPNVEAAVEYALQHAQLRAEQQEAGQLPTGIGRGAQLTPRRLTATIGVTPASHEQLPPVSHVACGARHTVWVSHCGAVYTCGAGATGALGHGGTGDELLPRRVARLSGTRVMLAAAGSSHSLFLCDGGALFACGSGEEGALGLDDGRDKALPVQCPWNGAPVRGIAAGGSTSALWCPLQTADELPRCASTDTASSLQSALQAMDTADGATAHAQALRAVCAAIETTFGSVAGAAGTFMVRPLSAARGPALIDAQRLETVAVRVLHVGLRHPEVISVLRDATGHLLDDLATCWSVQPDACEAAAAAAVAAQSPLLSQPGLAGALYRKLCPMLADWVAGFPESRAQALLCAGWRATPSTLRASRVVRPLNGFITSELASCRSTTPAVVSAVKVLGLLHAVNGECPDALPAEEFYNPFISEHANVAEDFGLWMNNGATFTFCAHAFVLNPAAKAKLLRLEAALRMQYTVNAARQQAMFSLPPESPRWLRFLAGEVGNPFAPSEQEQRQEAEQEAARRAVRHLARQPSLSAGPPPSACGVPATSPDWCILRVRRRCLVQDALEEVARQHSNDLFKPLRVHFIGEEAVDAGGPKKELFYLLMEELLSTQHGLFVEVAHGRLRWLAPDTAAPGTADDEALQLRWRLVGTLLALAIYNGVILDLHLPQTFYKKLLGVPVGLDDLAELDSEVAQSMRKLLAWTGPGSVEDVFCLAFNFTAANGSVIPLIDAGGEVPVTEANRQQFVDLYVAYALNRCCARAFAALRAQFLQLCGGHALRLVSPAELEILVCGQQHLDMKALEAGASYSGGYSGSHQIIGWFWQVVHDKLSLEDHKLLLRFITGSDRAPIGGLAALSIHITREGPDSFRLPTSHTCFSQLDLPEYSSRGKLHDRLITAIHNAASGFGIV